MCADTFFPARCVLCMCVFTCIFSACMPVPCASAVRSATLCVSVPCACIDYMLWFARLAMTECFMCLAYYTKRKDGLYAHLSNATGRVAAWPCGAEETTATRRSAPKHGRDEIEPTTTLTHPHAYRNLLRYSTDNASKDSAVIQFDALLDRVRYCASNSMRESSLYRFIVCSLAERTDLDVVIWLRYKVRVLPSFVALEPGMRTLRIVFSITYSCATWVIYVWDSLTQPFELRAYSAFLALFLVLSRSFDFRTYTTTCHSHMFSQHSTGRAHIRAAILCSC